MIEWNWNREVLSPEDVLDAANSIPVRSDRITIGLTGSWTTSDQLLKWARDALDRGGDAGWDAAAGLAKRAVCRQMDGILVHNHLGSFLGKNYGKKAEYLTELKIPGLALLRDFVIDPRNDIEHAYQKATESQARRAFDAAELFVGATQDAANIPAFVALGWNVRSTESMCSAPGKEHHLIQLWLTKDHDPMLLIAGYPDDPHINLIIPRDETLRVCPLRELTSAQVIVLNNRLRECMKSQSYSSRSIGPAFAKALKEQLKL